MSKVFVTTYEVIGALDIATIHYAVVDAAQKACFDFADQVGGEGYRPSTNGSLRSVFFKALPAGWRKIGADHRAVEAVPLKSTKIGKALAAQMAALPSAPSSHDLAALFGYNPPHFPIDGGRIFFVTDLRILFPSERIFLSIPRFAEDGFKPDETILRALPESEFMAAIEAHNTEARRRNEGGAA